MKTNIKLSASALVIAMTAMSAQAHAGGVQVDNRSLTDVLVAKGVLSKSEAMAIKKNNEGKLKFEGEVFATTRYNKKQQNRAGVVSTTGKDSGLTIDRAYLTARYSFDENWMMRITTDVNLDANLAKKNNNIFLKYAYLQGKLIGDALVLRLGQSHTPWIDHEEHLWGHRYVSPVFIDKHGFSASSDLGIGLKGKLAGGMVNYWLTETDGAGYSHPGMHFDAPTRTWKSGLPSAFDFDSRIGLNLMPGMTLDFEFRDGFKGTRYFDSVNNRTTAGTKHTLTQFMATYGQGHDWRVGLNLVSEKSDRKADTVATTVVTAQTDKTTGFSLWARAKMPGSKFGAFGRWDYDKVKRSTPATTISPKTNRYLLGLEYFPTRNVALSAVYDYSKTTNDKFVSNDWADSATFGLYANFKY